MELIVMKRCLVFILDWLSFFCFLVEAMIACLFQQRAGGRAAKNRDFFACLAFSLAPDTLGE